MATSPHTTPQLLHPRKAAHCETGVSRCAPDGREVGNFSNGDVIDRRSNGAQRQEVDGGVRLAGGRRTLEGAHGIELSMDGDSASLSTLPPPYSQLSA